MFKVNNKDTRTTSNGISLEQNDEMSDFFAFQYKFMEIKS